MVIAGLVKSLEVIMKTSDLNRDEMLTTMEVIFTRFPLSSVGFHNPGVVSRTTLLDRKSIKVDFVRCSGNVTFSNAMIRTAENTNGNNAAHAQNYIDSMLLGLMQSIVVHIFYGVMKLIDDPEVTFQLAPEPGMLNKLDAPQKLLTLIQTFRGTQLSLNVTSANVTSLAIIFPADYSIPVKTLVSRTDMQGDKNANKLTQFINTVQIQGSVSTQAVQFPKTVEPRILLDALNCICLPQCALEASHISLPNSSGVLDVIISSKRALESIEDEDIQDLREKIVAEYGDGVFDRIDRSAKETRKHMTKLISMGEKVCKMMVINMLSVRTHSVAVLVNGSVFAMTPRTTSAQIDNSAKFDETLFAVTTSFAISPEPAMQFEGYNIHNALITPLVGAEATTSVEYHYCKKTDSEDIDEFVHSVITAQFRDPSMGRNKHHVIVFPPQAELDEYDAFNAAGLGDVNGDAASGPERVLRAVHNQYTMETRSDPGKFSRLYGVITKMPAKWAHRTTRAMTFEEAPQQSIYDALAERGLLSRAEISSDRKLTEGQLLTN